MIRIRRRLRGEDGQTSVELLGMLPFLVIAAMAAWQILLVGYAVTSAENAARAASRVEVRGGDGEKAAKRVIGGPAAQGHPDRHRRDEGDGAGARPAARAGYLKREARRQPRRGAAAMTKEKPWA